MKKVIGIGNALVDILVNLNDDSILNEINFPKGSMQLVDAEESSKVFKKLEGLKMTQASGGSAANTIHGLASLGAETSYLGKIGNDDFGTFFKNDLENNNIQPKLLFGKDATGRAIAMVTPDSERTFATFLGAAIELVPENITQDIFEGYDILHLEGYLVQNNELIESCLKKAKEAGLETSIDLASFNVVEDNRDFLLSLINQYVDIVFANEDEAKALTLKEPEAALADIAKMAKIAVVKLGKNGSMIKTNDEVANIKTDVVKSIDTTGAGDLYASGFLFGYSKGLSLEKSGEIGSLLGSTVVQYLGAKIPKEIWEKEILKRVNTIIEE